MKKLIKLTATMLIGMIAFYACKEKKSINSNSTTTTSVTKTDPCDNVSFTTVNALIQERCVGCHNGSKAAYGIDLSQKDVIKEVANSGKLLCIIQALSNVKKCLL